MRLDRKLFKLASVRYDRAEDVVILAITGEYARITIFDWRTQSRAYGQAVGGNVWLWNDFVNFKAFLRPANAEMLTGNKESIIELHDSDGDETPAMLTIKPLPAEIRCMLQVSSDPLWVWDEGMRQGLMDYYTLKNMTFYEGGVLLALTNSERGLAWREMRQKDLKFQRTWTVLTYKQFEMTDAEIHAQIESSK